MTTKKTIFITGATGLLGSRILKEFLRANLHIYCLVRGENQNRAEQRFLETLRNLYHKIPGRKLLRQIKVIKGTLEDLSSPKEEFDGIFNRVDEICHCAANTSFRQTLKEARVANVIGTENVLTFAKKCKNLKKINYISTTFIVGNGPRFFHEYDEINVGQDFNNNYEKTKNEAERLIQKYSDQGMPISIFRPSIISGEFLSGETSNFKMLYEPLHFFSLGLFESVPANEDSLHNIIPVDVASKAITVIAAKDLPPDIYHITSPINNSFTMFFNSASEYFGYKNPKFIPLESFKMEELTAIQRRILEPFIPYFNYKALFLSQKTQSKLLEYGFEYPLINKAFFKRLFKFCFQIGFIKKTKIFKR